MKKMTKKNLFFLGVMVFTFFLAGTAYAGEGSEAGVSDEMSEEIGLNVDPLALVEHLSFDSSDNVGLGIMKDTAGSYYKLIIAVATVGLLISIMVTAIRIMVFGRSAAKEAIMSVVYKGLIFVCIFGFVDLWAVIYPIIQELL